MRYTLHLDYRKKLRKYLRWYLRSAWIIVNISVTIYDNDLGLLYAYACTVFLQGYFLHCPQGYFSSCVFTYFLVYASTVFVYLCSTHIFFCIFTLFYLVIVSQLLVACLHSLPYYLCFDFLWKLLPKIDCTTVQCSGEIFYHNFYIYLMITV